MFKNREVLVDTLILLVCIAALALIFSIPQDVLVLGLTYKGF